MKRKTFFHVLIVLALIFIWGNSFLGTASYKLSGSLKDFLGMDELVLRKLAHLTEYAVLGAVLALALRKTKHKLIIVLGSGLAVAVIDELIQSISLYRHSSPFDVLLDMCGFMVSLFFFTKKAEIMYQ